jgi:hypothetical protein
MNQSLSILLVEDAAEDVARRRAVLDEHGI